MAEDVPKTIILSLLILTVLISVLGTWTVLDKVNDVRVQYAVEDQHTDNGNVRIGFLDPNDVKEEVPSSAAATGNVVIGFMEPPKEEAN